MAIGIAGIACCLVCKKGTVRKDGICDYCGYNHNKGESAGKSAENPTAPKGDDDVLCTDSPSDDQ